MIELESENEAGSRTSFIYRYPFVVMFDSQIRGQDRTISSWDKIIPLLVLFL